MVKEAIASERAPDTSHHRPRVVVVGGGVAGITTAYELRRTVGDQATISLVSNREQFVLGPALAGAPFRHGRPHVGFALAPALARHDITFIHAAVERIEPERRAVRAADQEIPYDYLVVATGPQITDIPASGNAGGVLHTIHTESGALATREAVARVLERPGPAVVGLAPGAGYLSAAYEFVLQLDYELRRRDRRDHVTIAFVTPEVHLGYLGAPATGARRIMEWLFATRRITVFTGAVIDHVADDAVYLHDGTRLPAALAVVLPEVGGVPAILRAAGLTDEFGFIPVDAQYRHQRYPDIYAAGLAARLQIPAADGVPRTAYLAAAAGRAVASNLAAVIRGDVPAAPTLPRLVDLSILDCGDAGVLLAGAGVPLPFHVAIPLPGRLAHWLNEALLRYLLWKLRAGRTDLP